MRRSTPNLSGWTAGAGIAAAFAPNWSAFTEYRRTDYGSTTVTLPFSQFSTTSATKVSEVDIGVNYKFDWAASQSANAVPHKPAAEVLLAKTPSISPAFSWTWIVYRRRWRLSLE